MADCAPLLDEELSSFVFSYLTENSGSQIEEENAALLAALTDSLDGMVDAEVGGLSVFPTLEEEPSQEEEDERSLPLSAEDFSQSLGAETEDLSLLKKLLLTPPNVPTGIDVHKDGVQSHRCSNRSLRLRTVRPLTKERKPRAVRPTSRLCTELHRHLTTAQDTEDAPVHDTDEGEDEEEDEDSESEEDEEEEGEEEEEESSSSEVEGAVAAAAGPAEPAAPQFSSEKELQSVVELITYMHTYCLPMRKQQGWDRKDRDLSRQRTKPDVPRPANTNSHSRVVLVSAPVTSGSLNGTSSSAPRRLPFARRREMKVNSLLRELLQQSSSFDVSKPYRLHSPPYAHSHSPSRGTASAPSAPANKYPPAQSFRSIHPNPEFWKDSSSLERRNSSSELQQNLEEPAETSSSFSVRRSRRLASFPSRFAKRLRPTRAKEEEGKEKDENHMDKRACLCLPLNPKSTEPQFSTRPYEQTLSVDLCGTALTPPTTPPHKSVEDELFKPTDGGKCCSSSDGGSGSESVHPASNTNTNVTAKGSTWLSRSHHQRKLPEQTELYAQLRRMGQVGEGDTQRTFGDHDYCALSLGESRKRSAAMLGAILQTQGGSEGDGTQSSSVVVLDEKVQKCEEERLVMTEVVETQEQQTTMVLLSSTPSDCENCQVFYIHNLPSRVTENMLRRRFQVFGNAEDCKVIICNEAGPGPVKSKYDALDFDTLLKEAQKSLHR
uniref:Uncharacterized protein n=1 Tax=Xiphophorus couchianus TaxID=32473 RepID=A0A3B5M8Z0_9TELE